MKKPADLLKLLVFLFCITSQLIAAGQDPNAASNFKPEQLEQLVAPIALYPDSLLSQLLMASTYPLEIVQADRWLKQNSSLKGDAMAAELEKKSWDPSVKSLLNFPDVLKMMSEKLDWTQNLGDAFLAQQKDVLDAVQKLRQKAQDEGSLKTTDQQTVTEDQQEILIQPADPETVYVPTYDPAVVYGTWPYPSYPPYYWYPPGYRAGSNLLSFGVGVGLGAAWGYAWGHTDWHGGNVDVDFNQNVNLNRNINRDNYKKNYQNRGQLDQNGRGTWQHNPADRRGVPYRNDATAQKYNRGSNPSDAQAREAYRGRTGNAAAGPGRAGAGQYGNQMGTSQRSNVGQSAAGRNMGTSNYAGGGGAFQGMDSGSAARASSSRGQASRQSMSSGAGSMGGGGGGGMRGGGGRGGGGRGGGGGRR